jgi:hypothetical protein
MMNGQSLLEHIDFMSVEAKLYIKGKDRYKTKLGSLMTILSFASVIVISTFFLKYWFEKVDINVLFMKETSDEEMSMDFNSKPFFFKLTDVNSIDTDPRLVSLTIIKLIVSDKKAIIENLELESCSSEKHFPDPKYKKILENSDYGSFLCIKNEKKNLNMTLNLKKNINGYFNVYVHECNNSTLNNNSCYSKEKIKEYLSTANFYIRYYIPDVQIDHYNTEEPLQEKVFSIIRKIYPEMMYRYLNLFKQVKYTSDEGRVMQDSKTWTSFGRDEASYTEISPKAAVLVPNTLSALTFNMEGAKVDSYNRSYQKLQTVMANIGGILKFITFISTFIVKYVSSQMLAVDLSNNFVCDEEKLQKTNTNLTRKSTITTDRSKSTVVPILNTSSPVIKTATRRRSLTFFEALMPKQWTKASSAKKNLDNYSDIIKFYMSTNNFLKLFKDFENLKYLYLNQKESEIFEYMRCDSLKEHLEKMQKIEKMQKLNEKNLNSICKDKYINNLLKSIEDKENPSSDNRILQKMMERL